MLSQCQSLLRLFACYSPKILIIQPPPPTTYRRISSGLYSCSLSLWKISYNLRQLYGMTDCQDISHQYLLSWYDSTCSITRYVVGEEHHCPALYDRVTDVESFNIKPSLHIRVNRFLRIQNRRQAAVLSDTTVVLAPVRKAPPVRIPPAAPLFFVGAGVSGVFVISVVYCCRSVFIRAGLVIQVNADQLVPGKSENSKCR